MIVCGTPRSGTSLMLMLLKGSVSNVPVKSDKEYKRVEEDGDWIIKGPHLVLQHPVRPVIMVRDPRSVLTSRLGTHQTKQRPTDYFYDMYTFDHRNRRGVGLMHCALAIAKYMNERSALIMKYEFLTKYPEVAQRQVGEWWGLEYHRDWSEYPWNLSKSDRDHKVWDYKLNGVRPIDPGHDWRDHMDRVREVYTEHPELQLVLELFGYEQDTSWLGDIPPPVWEHKPASVTVKLR